MEITDIKIRKIIDEGKIKAIVSVTLDDCLVVHDIRVVEGNTRVFVASPSRKGADGKFHDIVHPINADFREKFETTILNKYEELTK